MTPDGSAVIAADRIGHLRMWSLPGRELLWSRNDVPTAWMAVSPDGRYLATAGNTFAGPPAIPSWPDSPSPWTGIQDGDPVTSEFTVWDLSTRTVHLRGDLNDWQYQPTPTSVVFSPDGGRVAVSYLQGFVMIYDVAQARRTLWLKSFLTAPSSMAFSPDGTRLLAASPDYLKVVDADTAEEVSLSLPPGLHDVNRMAYTGDGRWLVISQPRSVTVLDARTLHVAVAELPLPTETTTNAFAEAFALASGEAHQLIVGTRSVLASLEMDPERWKAAACQLVGRTLTKDEWSRFLPSIPYDPACG